jgi:anti-sigma factor RsiW
MIHDEIEELLGAYALHATEPTESEQIDAHLAECPRCRAEVASHQEAAAMLGSWGAEAPPGVWEKIATAIAENGPAATAERPAPTLAPRVVRLTPNRLAHQPRRSLVWGAVACVAAAVAIFLGVEVAQLNSQVGSMRSTLSRYGLAEAAAETAFGPHRTITLASVDHTTAATIIVAPTGAAYWVGSDLRHLPSSQTYQLWGLSRGELVSLGLVGPNPHAIDYFRLETDISKIMVTAEPRGGTAVPTTAVLAAGDVA